MTSTKAMENHPMFASQNYTKSEKKSDKSDLFSQFLDMTSTSSSNDTGNSKVGIVNVAKSNIKSYDSSLSGMEDKVFTKDESFNDRKKDTIELDRKTDDYEDSNKLTKSDERVKKEDAVDDYKDSNEESLEKKILKVSEKLKSKLCKALNISEEELNELLANSQLTILSLFNQDSLMQFAMAVSGTEDMSQILTDESALNILQTITQAVNEIDVEQLTGITKDEFSQLVTDVLNGNYVTLGVEDMDSSNSPMNNSNELLNNATNKDLAMKNDSGDDIIADTIQVEDGVVNGQEDANNAKGENMDTQVDEESAQSKKTLTIDVEKGTSNNEGNSSKNDSNTNTALDAFTNNLAVALNQTAASNEVNFAGQIAHVREVKQVIDQIVTQIKVTVTKDTQSIQMQLNPENLGRVNMTITSKNGVMTAQFIVESEAAKEAIESQIKLLIENLNDQGLKVENLEVTTREFAFNQQDSSQSQSQNNSKAKKAFRTEFVTEETSQTEEVEEILNENNTVSYLA